MPSKLSVIDYEAPNISCSFASQGLSTTLHQNAHDLPEVGSPITNLAHPGSRSVVGLLNIPSNTTQSLQAR